MLYAVILVSIVLTVSLSLFDISYRQIVLSSTIESQQKSFYVTDSVRDCIRYYNYYSDFNINALNYNYFGLFPDDNAALVTDPNDPFDTPLDCGASAGFSYSGPTGHLTINNDD